MPQQIIAAYLFRRQQQHMRSVDAAAETAEYFGIDVAGVAAAVLPLESGFSAAQLGLLTA